MNLLQIICVMHLLIVETCIIILQEDPNRCNLYVPQPNLEYFKRSFIYVGPNVWNDIPDSVRNVNSKHSFKKE